jgi:hypothetical protein
MDAPMFTPLEMDPAWKILYNKFHDRDYGNIITKDEITLALPKHRHPRGAIYRCIKEMEEKDNKILKSERNRGYRVMPPGQHIEVGAFRILRGTRQVKKGDHTLKATNVSLITPTERIQLSNMKSRTSRILCAMRKRVVEGEQVAVKEKVEVNMTDVERRLKRIEELIKKKKKIRA